MVFTLIGMPGCGKSCMGRGLSSKLKIKNIDSDKLIQKITGKWLIDIIRDEGKAGFMKIEEQILLDFHDDPAILSTGGSAVYYPRVMEHLKSLGPVIYLYCSYDVIEKRLGDFSQRGVLLSDGQTLKDLYDERTELYKRYADVTVDCSGNRFPLYRERVLNTIRYYLDLEN